MKAISPSNMADVGTVRVTVYLHDRSILVIKTRGAVNGPSDVLGSVPFRFNPPSLPRWGKIVLTLVGRKAMPQQTYGVWSERACRR
jgi:hypothetical protein